MVEFTLSRNISFAMLSIPEFIIISLGFCGIFKKSGVKKRWAFIPIAREYHLSLCAEAEKEGRIYVVMSVIYYALSAVIRFLPEQFMRISLFLMIPAIALYVCMVIYSIKIYQGLIKVYNRKRSWIWMFIFFEFITVLIWGFSSKFVPSRKVVDLSSAKAAKEVGEDLKAACDVLTVNIRERSTIEFFKKKMLLRDIHMQIPKGHLVLLLGGSGAGKTTYLNALTGYEKAKAKIMLGQQDVYKDYSKMKYDIGFVPQEDLMRGNDTVYLTLADAARLRLPEQMSLMERDNRIARVLDQFGLTAARNTLVEKLSGGQRKRLSICMEFITEPDLFILDEPDSGLDGVVARNLFEKLREIADDGKIVIVITHTPDRVADLFDDVIVLAKDATRTGRLAYYGPIDEAYEFFGKNSMEEILLSINQKDEGGEGRADEFIEKYADKVKEKVG